jgi:hypothetical protein
MKRDLRIILYETGKAFRKSKELVPNFEHYSMLLRHHHVNLTPKSLKRIWEVLKGRRRLSPEALDRLALFAGFQSWKDLHDTLHGDTDASVNYNS